jgi:hypothetical protein
VYSTVSGRPSSEAATAGGAVEQLSAANSATAMNAITSFFTDFHQ